MRFVHLAEYSEQEVLLVVGYADTGIGNGEGDFLLAARCAAARCYAYLHLTFFGELDRIAGQIRQHLVEPCLVADQSLRHIVSHRAIEVKTLALRGGKRMLHVFSTHFRIENGFDLHREFTHLDFCHVKDIVEYPDQGAGRCLSYSDKFPLLRFEVAEKGDIEHAEDAGHRSAQFVAHVGEELALGPLPPGHVLRLLQRFCPQALGYVTGDL